MLTTVEPLKSALSTAGADDTSLAVPTDDTLRSGQRRVLDQVLTVKRSKSKHGRTSTMSARTLSPTSRQRLSLLARCDLCLFYFHIPTEGSCEPTQYLPVRAPFQNYANCKEVAPTASSSERKIVFGRSLVPVLRKMAIQIPIMSGCLNCEI